MDTLAHVTFKGTYRRGDGKTELLFGMRDWMYMGVNQLVETSFIQKLLVMCMTILEDEGGSVIYTPSYIVKSYFLAFLILFLSLKRQLMRRPRFGLLPGF